MCGIWIPVDKTVVKLQRKYPTVCEQVDLVEYVDWSTYGPGSYSAYLLQPVATDPLA